MKTQTTKLNELGNTRYERGIQQRDTNKKLIVSAWNERYISPSKTFIKSLSDKINQRNGRQYEFENNVEEMEQSKKDKDKIIRYW